MNKFTDDIPLQPRGRVQPTTVPALLRRLRLADAAAGKKAAISDWLGDHEPSATMKRSLERHGYADLLRSRLA